MVEEAQRALVRRLALLAAPHCLEGLVTHVPFVPVVLLEEAREQREAREAAHQRDELAEVKRAAVVHIEGGHEARLGGALQLEVEEGEGHPSVLRCDGSDPLPVGHLEEVEQVECELAVPQRREPQQCPHREKPARCLVTSGEGQGEHTPLEDIASVQLHTGRLGPRADLDDLVEQEVLLPTPAQGGEVVGELEEAPAVLEEVLLRLIDRLVGRRRRLGRCPLRHLHPRLALSGVRADARLEGSLVPL